MFPIITHKAIDPEGKEVDYQRFSSKFPYTLIRLQPFDTWFSMSDIVKIAVECWQPIGAPHDKEIKKPDNIIFD